MIMKALMFAAVVGWAMLMVFVALFFVPAGTLHLGNYLVPILNERLPTSVWYLFIFKSLTLVVVWWLSLAAVTFVLKLIPGSPVGGITNEKAKRGVNRNRPHVHDDDSLGS